MQVPPGTVHVELNVPVQKEETEFSSSQDKTDVKIPASLASFSFLVHSKSNSLASLESSELHHILPAKNILFALLSQAIYVAYNN